MSSTDNTGVFYITPQQLKKALVVLWRAKVPAAIFGAPGCGKTTAVTELINNLNAQRNKDSPEMKLWSIILSYKGPEDIGGIPYPNKDHTRVTYLLPEELPFGTDEHGIIFGDEFDRASPETQNSFLQLLLGGSIHGKAISPNAYIVLAMNGTSDIYTTQLSDAAITRVCTLFVSANADGYLDSYDSWAEDNSISSEMRAFVRFNPQLIASNDTFTPLAKSNARTSVMADRILKAMATVKFDISDIRKPMLAGVIGRAEALKLIAFHEQCANLPSVDSIIKDPKKTIVPERNDLIYALIGSIVQRVSKSSDIKTIDRICAYAVRLPDEFASSLFRQLYNKNDKVITNKEYDSWVQRSKGILGLKGR